MGHWEFPQALVMVAGCFCPEGVKACSLGREPQVRRHPHSLSPGGATAAPRSEECCRPLGLRAFCGAGDLGRPARYTHL
jgi:hypothetical protein